MASSGTDERLYRSMGTLITTFDGPNQEVRFLRCHKVIILGVGIDIVYRSAVALDLVGRVAAIWGGGGRRRPLRGSRVRH